MLRETAKTLAEDAYGLPTLLYPSQTRPTIRLRYLALDISTLSMEENKSQSF